MGYLVKRNLAKRAKEIAWHRNIPIITAETVIRDYIESLKKSGELGEVIVIDGVVSIYPVKNGITGEISTRSRVSEAYKERLRNSPDILTVMNPDQDFIEGLDEGLEEVDFDFIKQPTN